MMIRVPLHSAGRQEGDGNGISRCIVFRILQFSEKVSALRKVPDHKT
jgi:hypothetical protein